MRSVLAAAVLIIFPWVDAAQLKAGVSAAGEWEHVCFSLAAFEEPDFIDALINNFAHFTDESSRMSIHLNSLTEYDPKQLKKWDGAKDGRVVLTEQRVPVRWFKGSIFYAHLLNARRMEEMWPGYCKYYVMQASNMMWVRQGVEAQVRRQKYAQLIDQPDTLKENWEQPMTRDMYNEGRHKLGWGQPEGAFYPMKLVRDFDVYMKSWMQTNGYNESYLVDMKLYAEAFWFQHYALNLADPQPPKEFDYESTLPICWRHIITDQGHDSVPMDELEKVMEGKDKWANYYAVKRVNRWLGHPTTKYIVSLSK